jgi:hypothetical protein
VDEVCVLDNEDDEFISPQNFPLYREEISNIYNSLADDVNNYQFENFEEYQNLELKSSDLDRSEITSLKDRLVNFFKYCLSRSNYYELNPNLVRQDKPKPQDFTGVFANLSNCQISDLAEVKLKPTLLTLVLSYNKIASLEPLAAYPQLQRLDLSHNEISYLAGLDRLQQLETLDLTHNNLCDISQLQVLKHNALLTDLKVVFLLLRPMRYSSTRSQTPRKSEMQRWQS